MTDASPARSPAARLRRTSSSASSSRPQKKRTSDSTTCAERARPAGSSGPPPTSTPRRASASPRGGHRGWTPAAPPRRTRWRPPARQLGPGPLDQGGGPVHEVAPQAGLGEQVQRRRQPDRQPEVVVSALAWAVRTSSARASNRAWPTASSGPRSSRSAASADAVTWAAWRPASSPDLAGGGEAPAGVVPDRGEHAEAGDVAPGVRQDERPLGQPPEPLGGIGAARHRRHVRGRDRSGEHAQVGE